MSQRKQLVLVASGSDNEAVRFDDADWQRVEARYGFALPKGVRHEIEHVTIEYVAGASFEKQAASAAEAKSELYEIRESAEHFSQVIGRTSGKIDAVFYARHLFRNHIVHDLLPNAKAPTYEGDQIQVISELVNSCTAACDKAIGELDHPAYTRLEGEAWLQWIKKLTMILDEAELRTGASNASDVASPFVRLVRELQRSVPDEYRRHLHSDSALAKAINRAR